MLKHPDMRRPNGMAWALPLLMGAVLAWAAEPPSDYQRLLRQAKQALDGEDYDEALARADEAIALRPGLAKAYLYRGIAKKLSRGRSKALADFSKAIELDPLSVDAYLFRADCHLGRTEPALKDYDKVLELDPLNVSAYEGRAFEYDLARRYDEAVADYEKAVALGPRTPGVYHALSRHYRAQGRDDKAKELLLNGLKRFPEDEALQRDLELLGALDEVRETLERIQEPKAPKTK